MSMQSFYRVVADDFSAVNNIIKKQLCSRVPLVEEVADYLIAAGGKRLRPLLTLLAGRALDYRDDNLQLLAATIEFLHTSTLLHDDVVDKSTLRRGLATANAQWGNAPSVLVGDFLYARAFEMMVELDSMQVMRHDADTSEAVYLDVIRSKTAMLFSAASHSAAALSGAPPSRCEALRQFGDHLGIADYQGDSSKMGKNLGDDLAEGKPTLPLIYCIREGSAQQADLVRQAIVQGGGELAAICQAVKDCGALNYTQQLAEQHAAKALDCLDALPANDCREALADLARFSVARQY